MRHHVPHNVVLALSKELFKILSVCTLMQCVIRFTINKDVMIANHNIVLLETSVRFLLKDTLQINVCFWNICSVSCSLSCNCHDPIAFFWSALAPRCIMTGSLISSSYNSDWRSCCCISLLSTNFLLSFKVPRTGIVLRKKVL